jgi:hypothetical protein
MLGRNPGGSSESNAPHPPRRRPSTSSVYVSPIPSSSIPPKPPPPPKTPTPLVQSDTFHRPDMIPKLNVALQHHGASYVDMATEVPNMIYFIADDDAVRMKVNHFYPTCHSHGGGTWRWHRGRLSSPPTLPPSRSHYSPVALAAALAAERLKPTRGDCLFLLNTYTIHVSCYHTAKHEMSGCFPEQFGGNLGSLRSHCQAIRSAQRILDEMISKHSAAEPQFGVRFEVRFDGPAVASAVAGATPERRTELSIAFMRNMVSLLAWYMFEVWAIRPAAVPEITTFTLVAPPALHLGMLEATMSIISTNYSLTERTPLHHLHLQTLLRLHQHVAIMHAMLFSCSTADAAMLLAAEHLQGLQDGSRRMVQSRGSKTAEKKAKKGQGGGVQAAPSDNGSREEEEEVEAIDNEEEEEEGEEAGVREEGAAEEEIADDPPMVGSREELWLCVARSFEKATSLRRLMVALRIPIMRSKHVRLCRTEAEQRFAAAMAATRDVSAARMALNFNVNLDEQLIAELEVLGTPEL